jgi:transglutaminase-like putative cysteine protease
LDYTITHTTRYAYTSPVSVCQNIVALTPRNDGRVHCWVHRLRIRPSPINTHRRTDYFGNILTVFSIDENHEELTISAISRVTVGLPESKTSSQEMAWETVRQKLASRANSYWLETSSFLFDSPRVQRAEIYAEYARQSFLPGTSVLVAALDLVRRIHRDFTYDSKATETHTPTADAFEIRKGVCQDFAHIMIACLRSIGIPARYLSGYLRTIPPAGKPRLVGADQSHAWVSVYCGPEVGWVELDPTNSCLCGLDHIPIAWGRDYSDVVPVRGAYLGGGESAIGVSVDVVPQDAVLT